LWGLGLSSQGKTWKDCAPNLGGSGEQKKQGAQLRGGRHSITSQKNWGGRVRVKKSAQQRLKGTKKKSFDKGVLKIREGSGVWGIRLQLAGGGNLSQEGDRYVWGKPKVEKIKFKGIHKGQRPLILSQAPKRVTTERKKRWEMPREKKGLKKV